MSTSMNLSALLGDTLSAMLGGASSAIPDDEFSDDGDEGGGYDGLASGAGASCQRGGCLIASIGARQHIAINTSQSPTILISQSHPPSTIMPRRGRSRNAKNKRRRADDGDDYADEEDLSDICEQERRAQPPRKAKVRLLEDDVGFTTSAPKPRQTARTSTKGPAPKANTRLKSIKATTTKATKATSSRVTDSLEVSDASDASIASDSSDASDVFRPQRPTTANAATTTSSIEQAIKRLGISDSVLATAWKVNPKMVKKRLHFVFDAVAPYVEFKRGARFSMDKDFPERGDVTPSELTDSQGDGYVKEWMAYAPRDYRYDFDILAPHHEAMH